MFIKTLLKAPQFFSLFKHYKQIAQHLKIHIPPINEEINIDKNDPCFLIGYRKVCEGEDESKQEIVKDIFSREAMTFSEILDFAASIDRDVCVINEDEKQLTLQNIKEHVYKEYYWEKIFRRNSTAKKFKQIRLPEKIQKNDIRSKALNIKRMIARGQKTFRIYTENDSEKCEAALKHMLEILGKEDVQIVAETINPKFPDYERFVVKLELKDEVKIDFQIVNKKWRRYCLNQQMKSRQIEPFSADELHLENEDVNIQRQILNELRSSNIKFPSIFSEEERVSKLLEKNDPYALYESAFNQSDEILENIKNQKREEGQKEIKNVSYRIDRSVEEILQEMDKVKGESYQMTNFQQYRYKLLEKQLQKALKRATILQDVD